MSNHIDRIQEVKDLTEYAERNTCSATMVPTESLRALLSEYKRLQTAATNAIEVLEQIKKREMDAYNYESDVYLDAVSALSHRQA